MMGAYTRDTSGIAKILKRAETSAAVMAKAGPLAAYITAAHPDIEPGIHPGTTDRAVVTIAVANGAELQATEGLITRAASSVGLEVKA